MTVKDIIVKELVEGISEEIAGRLNTPPRTNIDFTLGYFLRQQKGTELWP